MVWALSRILPGQNMLELFCGCVQSKSTPPAFFVLYTESWVWVEDDPSLEFASPSFVTMFRTWKRTLDAILLSGVVVPWPMRVHSHSWCTFETLLASTVVSACAPVHFRISRLTLLSSLVFLLCRCLLLFGKGPLAHGTLAGGCTGLTCVTLRRMPEGSYVRYK